MARIRSVKPEAFTSEDFMSCDPLARLLFIGTWCESDSAGRFKYSAAALKARYLPSDDCDMEVLVKQLESRGMIQRYSVNGSALCQVTNFEKHQVINNRERKSELLGPDRSSVLKATTGRKEGTASKSPLSRVKAASADDFNRWYSAYPNKKSRGDAEKAWAKLKPDAELVVRMIAALVEQEVERTWKARDGLFCPEWKNPATWLRQRCWEDQVLPDPDQLRGETDVPF